MNVRNGKGGKQYNFKHEIWNMNLYMQIVYQWETEYADNYWKETLWLATWLLMFWTSISEVIQATCWNAHLVVLLLFTRFSNGKGGQIEISFSFTMCKSSDSQRAEAKLKTLKILYPCYLVLSY